MFINGDSSKLDRGLDTIKHEYGHLVQEKKYGELFYIIYVAIPSITHRESDPIKYYSYPWEYGADIYGGVQGQTYLPGTHKKWEDYEKDVLKIIKILLGY